LASLGGGPLPGVPGLRDGLEAPRGPGAFPGGPFPFPVRPPAPPEDGAGQKGGLAGPGGPGPAPALRLLDQPLKASGLPKEGPAAPYLASPEAFEALLFPEEKARLAYPGQAGEYYLGFLRLPHLLMDPEGFEAALREQEERALALPLFLNAFHRVQGP